MSTAPFGILLIGMLGWSGCQSEEKASAAANEASAAANEASAATNEASTSAATSPNNSIEAGTETSQPAPTPKLTLKGKVRAIVLERGERTKCNDVNGCPMVGTLISLGPGAAAAVEDAYKSSKGDGHWRFRLLEVLGRLRNRASGRFLLDVLERDKYPKARAEAALALARLGDRAHLTALKAAAANLNDPAWQPSLLATAYALASLGDENGRTLIEKHLIVPDGEYRRWDKLRPGVYAAGQLRMKKLRERLEAILVRADPFVRREAAKALGAMRDRAAIPALVEGLKDRVPGVRKEALQSLKTLTGFRHKESYEQWTRWLAREAQQSKKP